MYIFIFLFIVNNLGIIFIYFALVLCFNVIIQIKFYCAFQAHLIFINILLLAIISHIRIIKFVMSNRNLFEIMFECSLIYLTINSVV